MEKLNSVDLVYKIGAYMNEKKNAKLQGEQFKIYFFSRQNLSIISMVKENEKYVYYINPLTDIIDVVNFFDEVLMMNFLETIDVEEVTMENLTVDRIEKTIYTLLTEDNISIDIDEDFFSVYPKEGDLVNSALEIEQKITEEKKMSIAEKFNKLKK